MRHLLIPSGQVHFPGNQEQLLKTIQRVNGTPLTDRKFRCYFPQPFSKILRFRFVRRSATFSSWCFQCAYAPSSSGFLISYRVLPGFSVVFPMLFLFVAPAANLFLHGSNARGWFPVLICIPIAVVLGALFYFERREYILKFQKLFSSFDPFS